MSKFKEFLKNKNILQNDAIDNDDALLALIDEFGEAQLYKGRVMYVEDISSRIEPYLSDEVKVWWKKPLEAGVGKDSEGELHACFMTC